MDRSSSWTNWVGKKTPGSIQYVINGTLRQRNGASEYSRETGVIPRWNMVRSLIPDVFCHFTMLSSEVGLRAYGRRAEKKKTSWQSRNVMGSVSKLKKYSSMYIKERIETRQIRPAGEKNHQWHHYLERLEGRFRSLWPSCCFLSHST